MEIGKDWWQCRCGSYLGSVVNKCPSCGFEKSSRQTFADVRGVDSELELHREIMSYLDGKRWPYIHARTDVPSTIGEGAADFVVFLPGGRLLICELKSRTGKQSPKQMAWQMMVEAQGHSYHIARSMEQFMELLGL